MLWRSCIKDYFAFFANFQFYFKATDDAINRFWFYKDLKILVSLNAHFFICCFSFFVNIKNQIDCEVKNIKQKIILNTSRCFVVESKIKKKVEKKNSVWVLHLNSWLAASNWVSEERLNVSVRLVTLARLEKIALKRLRNLFAF